MYYHQQKWKTKSPHSLEIIQLEVHAGLNPLIKASDLIVIKMTFVWIKVCGGFLLDEDE